ncbi:MAG: trypsin-like serine protease [Bacteroidia bacterium]
MDIVKVFSNEPAPELVRDAQSIAQIPPVSLPVMDEDSLQAIHEELKVDSAFQVPFDSIATFPFSEPLMLEGMDIQLDTLEFDRKYYFLDPQIYPGNCTGKLIHREGQSSAALIGPRIILTAAHCVHSGPEGNGLKKGISFQPGFPSHGKWYTIDQIFIPNDWVVEKKLTADYAICTLTEPVTNGNYYGIQVMANDSRGGWIKLGYPSYPKELFNGKKLVSDFGRSYWRTGRTLGAENLIGSWDNDMEYGASGGPWINKDEYMKGEILTHSRNAKGEFGNYINGVTSHGLKRKPGAVFSPYFGGKAKVFFQQVLNTLS